VTDGPPIDSRCEGCDGQAEQVTPDASRCPVCGYTFTTVPACPTLVPSHRRADPAIEPPFDSRWGADVEISLRLPADIFDDLVFAAMLRNRTVHRSGHTTPADVIRHILNEWAHGHAE